jgi:hypothetical protein
MMSLDGEFAQMNVHPNIGLMELIVLGMMALILIIPIWAIIDAASRPDKQWLGIGNNKGLWVILMLLGTLFCGPVGLIAAIYYLAVMRPRLNAVSGPPL